MVLHTLMNKHTLVAATALLLSFALPLMCATYQKPAADLIHPHPRATDHVASALSHVCEAMCGAACLCVSVSISRACPARSLSNLTLSTTPPLALP